MLGLIKYYIKMPVISLFVLLARRSKSYGLLQKDLQSYNKRWKVNYSLGGVLCRDVYYRNIFYNRVQDVRLLMKMKFILKAKDGLGIPDTLHLGGGVEWAHPTSTYLNAESIGDNFSFRQNTTIGNKIDGRNDLVPTIGNNVFVGANVCIIGKIRIGNNVIIGAGAVVTKNVPDNSVVVGNPMRIIDRNARINVHN